MKDAQFFLKDEMELLLVVLGVVVVMWLYMILILLLLSKSVARVMTSAVSQVDLVLAGKVAGVVE